MAVWFIEYFLFSFVEYSFFYYCYETWSKILSTFSLFHSFLSNQLYEIVSQLHIFSCRICIHWYIQSHTGWNKVQCKVQMRVKQCSCNQSFTQNASWSKCCQKVVIIDHFWVVRVDNFLDDNHKVVLVTAVLTTRWWPCVLFVIFNYYFKDANYLWIQICLNNCLYIIIALILMPYGLL